MGDSTEDCKPESKPLAINNVDDVEAVDVSSPQNVSVNSEKMKVYQTGWRLHALTAGLCLSLLLSTLETTIVSTSLVSIVNALRGFGQAGWVVTSYLLTYTGFLIIYAKLSDTLGTKLLLMIAIGLFTVFSLACGVSNSMLQLIIFRSFQGLGASGIYSLVSVMTPLMVPPAKYATYIAIISSVFAISSVLGPLLGGAITDHTTWRWVFYLNGPGGTLALLIIGISIPFSFPYASDHDTGLLTKLSAEKAWKKFDYLGGFASLTASILLVFALEQGGVVYSWGSAAIIAPFVLSGVLWVVFVLWERGLSLRKGALVEPLFPWGLACNRFVLGLLLNAFLTGFPFMAALINIPQRMQVVNGTTAVEAGLRMLPLLLCSPVATTVSGLLVSKLKVPPAYILLGGCCLQAVGIGLFSSLPSSGNLAIPAAQYGYQVIMGFGFGFNLGTCVIMVPMVVRQRDMAVTMGSVTQIRVLGGTIGLAVCSALLSTHVGMGTSEFLNNEQQGALLKSFQSIRVLPQDVQLRIREVYAIGYNQQMRAMLYFCAAAIVSLSLLAENSPRKLQMTDGGEIIVRGAERDVEK
ncbi:major facilitator superfamily transporter [Podospora australis]|uniref:Major facilitator superfamily transporter n=1 Tax=Podospora australis TaxID=1536484 RepID=A0AAN6WMK3_9PEZI|nr:major facilitator superfamily transporter [Podospora australis]